MIQTEKGKKISNALMGHKVSVETRKKISQSKSGTKLSDEHKEKLSKIFKGRKLPPFTEEHKLHISESRKGKSPWNKGKKGVQIGPWKGKRNPNMVGSKNPSWKGGTTALGLKIRSLPEFKIWRKSIFERDGYTCQKCKYSKGNIIEANHIVPLAWLLFYHKIKTSDDAIKCLELWDIDNGQTLCSKCHKKTSTWGKKYIKWFNFRKTLEEI